MEQNGWKRDVKRLVLVVAASCVMAMNIKSFVRAGGLFPGGFTGLTLLIQQAADDGNGRCVPSPDRPALIWRLRAPTLRKHAKTLS